MLPRLAWDAAVAMRNYRATPDELRLIQDRKARRLVRYSYDNIPLYHEMMRSEGLTPSDFKGADDLKRFKPLARETLANHYPEGVLSASSKTAKTFRTTGTTGKPLTIHFSPAFCDKRLAMVLRRERAEGIGFLDSCVTVETGTAPLLGEVNIPGGDGARLRKLRAFWKVLAGSIYPSLVTLRQKKLLLGKSTLEEIASELLRLRPDVLITRPSYARRLGEAVRGSAPGLSLKTVSVTAEYLSASCRSDIKGSFQSEVFETYGSSEFGALGFECREHSGIHLNADYFAFEAVKDGQEVAPGEEGEILITCLENETMPLIRYSQGDVVVVEGEQKCGCGSYLPRLRVVQGRRTDGLVNGEGIRVPPNLVVELLESSLGLRDFQLVQGDSRRFLLKLRPSDYKEAVFSGAPKLLEPLMGADVSVSFEAWSGEMPAKYRPVVSELLLR